MQPWTAGAKALATHSCAEHEKCRGEIYTPYTALLPSARQYWCIGLHAAARTSLWQTSKLVTLSQVFLSLFFLFAGIEKEGRKKKK